MSSSVIEIQEARAQQVDVNEDALLIEDFQDLNSHYHRTSDTLDYLCAVLLYLPTVVK